MKEIKNWEKSSQELAEYFVKKYFGKLEDFDCYWVADEIGGVLVINDYFFNLSSMIDFIRYKYKEKQMFDYYHYSIEEDSPINIKNWIKLK